MNIILSYYHHITIILPPYYHHIIMILPLSYYHHIIIISHEHHMVCYTDILYHFRAPRRCSLRLWLWVSAPPFQPPWGASCATAAAAEGGRFCRGNGGKTMKNLWKNMGSLRKNSCRNSKISKRKCWNFSFFATFPKNSPDVWRIPGYPEVLFRWDFWQSSLQDTWDMGIWGYGGWENKHQ